jgi:hypothetical protein
VRVSIIDFSPDPTCAQNSIHAATLAISRPNASRTDHCSFG